MKKKVIIFIVTFFMILNVFSTYKTVNAETKNNIEINLKGNSTVKQDTKTIELTLSLGNFVGVEENIVLGYEANVEYDKKMFSTVKVEGLNGWTASYESTTNVLIGELPTATARANSDIAKITLTLQSDVQPGVSGVFKLNNLQLTDSEDLDITVNKSITITKETEVEKEPEKQEGQTPEKQKDPEKQTQEESKTQEEQKAQQQKQPATTQQQKSNTQNTTATKKVSNLPYAGLQNFIVITLLIVFITGVLALIRYKTIKIK